MWNGLLFWGVYFSPTHFGGMEFWPIPLQSGQWFVAIGYFLLGAL
jgi:hypothetical protein